MMTIEEKKNKEKIRLKGLLFTFHIAGVGPNIRSTYQERIIKRRVARLRKRKAM